MLRLKRPPIEDVLLDFAQREHLESRRAGAASLSPGSKKIKSRWDSFTQGRGKDVDVGPRVVDATRAMSHDKCAYCESVKPATVEHYWPKAKYPSKMFDWDNLLASCRDCNSAKDADFPVSNGQPLLLNPVDDEPLEHLRWDGTTGRCLLRRRDPRATDTHRTLDLDRLATERLHKWTRVRTLLAACAKGAPVPADIADQLRHELAPTRPYLCVVRSMLLFPPDRQHRLIVTFAVKALPDILAWVAPWILPPSGVTWPPAP